MTVADGKRSASGSHPISAKSLIENVGNWAELHDDIRALAVVGSHARGEARSDSDVDLVVACADPTRYLRDTNWLSTFAPVTRSSFEDLVEFRITGTAWMAIPPDEGTATARGARARGRARGGLDSGLRS